VLLIEYYGVCVKTTSRFSKTTNCFTQNDVPISKNGELFSGKQHAVFGKTPQ
jgi:hypothetical protein